MRGVFNLTPVDVSDIRDVVRAGHKRASAKRYQGSADIWKTFLDSRAQGNPYDLFLRGLCLSDKQGILILFIKWLSEYGINANVHLPGLQFYFDGALEATDFFRTKPVLLARKSFKLGAKATAKLKLERFRCPISWEMITWMRTRLLAKGDIDSLMTYVCIAVCYNFLLRIGNAIRTTPLQSDEDHSYLNDEVTFETVGGLFFLTDAIHQHITSPSEIAMVTFTQFSSKTGTKGQGRNQSVSRLTSNEVELLDDIVSFCLRKDSYSPTEEFFHRHLGGKGKKMIPRMVNLELKAAASAFNLNPAHFTTHSLRIGGATELVHSGASTTALKSAGGWQSSVALQDPEGIHSVLTSTAGKPHVSHSDLLRLTKLKDLPGRHCS